MTHVVALLVVLGPPKGTHTCVPVPVCLQHPQFACHDTPTLSLLILLLTPLFGPCQGGGVFCNPVSPTAPAKLRLLYECAPLALVMEVGGGHRRGSAEVWYQPVHECL
jgi:hypothetical protein